MLLNYPPLQLSSHNRYEKSGTVETQPPGPSVYNYY